MERQRRIALAVEQADLRARFAQEARAAQDRITALVAARLGPGLIDPTRPGGGAGQRLFALREGTVAPSAAFSQLFPHTDRWLTERGAEQWVEDGLDIALIDYGTAIWSDRRLETAIIEVRLSMSNALRGERESHCVLLGLMLDDEFGMLREPFEASCEDLADARTWLQGVYFETRWSPR